MPRVKRVVIVGMPRCGTTLLATLLDAQQGCTFITDYVSGFHDVAERLAVRWNQPLDLPARRVALAVVRDQFLRLRHPVLVGVDAFSTLDDLHRLVLGELSDSTTRVAGHKLVLRSPQVRALLDQTSLDAILMYRDPRDAALSYWHRTGEGVESYLRDYKRMLRLARELEGHPRLFAIRFESLVTEPERALEPLSRALGLAIDPTIVSLKFRRGPAARALDWSDNSAFGDVTRRFDDAPLERWQKHPDSPVVRFAAWFCKSEIERLRYAPHPPLHARERARFAANAVTAAADHWLLAGAVRVSKALRRAAPPIRHR
jgi:hypothetical protein